MSIDTLRNDKRELPAYAWPGGYPLVYVDADGNLLCPDCANKPEDEYGAPIVDGFIHYEGPSMFCDDCYKEIESAYGDPEGDE